MLRSTHRELMTEREKPLARTHPREQSDAGAPRVMHLCKSLEMGGAEALAVQMASDQARRYHRPPWLTTLEPTVSAVLRQRLDNRVELLDAGMKAGVDGATAVALRRLVQRTGTRVIHAHNPGPLLAATIACVALPVRIVYTHHGSGVIPLFGRNPLLSSWLRYRCSHFVGVSPEATDRMQQSFRHRLAGRKVSTILNGIQLDAGAGEPGVGNEPWSSDGLPLIGCVGRLSREKRVDLVIDAVARLLAAGIPARLLIVGDGALRAALEQQSDALRRSGHVVFLGTRADVPQLLGHFSVFVNCSDMEGISLGILEAMAAARPVVATAVGGTPLLLEGESCGRLVPAGSAQALAVAIGELLADARERRRLGEAAAARVQLHFSFRSMMDRYETLYAP